MSDQISIKVEKLNKIYNVPHEKRNKAKDYFLNPFKKVGYEKFHALEEISFEIKKGEFLGVVGRNGGGKSTLLKLLAGIILPTSGSITMHGKVIPFLELGVGFNPDLTAKENVFLNGMILGMTKKQLIAKYDDIVSFAEVGNFMDAQLKTFSSGMIVRLAFSIAMQTNADIYLLDEVLAVGDANFQEKSLAKFLELKKEGKTVVLVSHDSEAIRKYCDKAVYVKHGKMQAFGDSGPIVDQYINDPIA